MNAKGHKYGDNELLTLWQEDYLQQKQEEYSDRKDKKEKKNKDKEVSHFSLNKNEDEIL